MDFLIAIFLGLSNGQRAAAKGHSRLLWIFLSVIAFVFLESFAGAIMMLLLYRGELRDNPGAMVQIARDFTANMEWTRSLLLLAIGFGGYLIIRYIIERMPDNSSRQEQL